MSVSWDDLSDIEIKKEKEIEENNTNLMLVDGVNLGFKYIQRANYGSFTDDYIRTISSLGKSYKAKRIICCFDSGSSNYRKILLPEYKANRKQERTPEEQDRFDKFFECLTATIDELPFEHYKFKGVEADDLIAYLSLNIKDYNHTWIISSDRDLIQLINETTSIFSTQTRKEKTLKSILDDTGYSPREYMLSRIIEGDIGDNIKGVTGIGPKRAAELIKSYKTLKGIIAALPIKGKSQYIHNLNNSEALLLKNEKLINLLDYNVDAIAMGENSELIFNYLQKAINNDS